MDDRFRSIVEAHFRVYEARQETLPGGRAYLYFLMFQAEELETKFQAARQAILAADPEVLVFLRHDGGEDVLVIAPRAPVAPATYGIHIVLFVLTLLTTISAGALYWQGYRYAGGDFSWAVLWSGEHLLQGFLTFSLPLLLILGVHESAHFIAAKRHGLRATLPYFLPFPPLALPIGTLGAFIRLKDPLPDRKALFDVGASGPIAGFAIAVPVLLLGGFLTGDMAVEAPDLDRPMVALEGAHLDESSTGKTRLKVVAPLEGVAILNITAPPDSWSYTARAVIVTANGTLTDTLTGKLAANATTLRTIAIPANATLLTVTVTWDDHLIRFGDSLLTWGMEKAGLTSDKFLTHPTFFAGWVGILITGINLLPAGQLDGGHVARALFGANTRFVGIATIIGLFALAFQFQPWIWMAFLILLFGLYHPPPLNDQASLGTKRKVLGFFVIALLAITFIPIPVLF